MRKKLSINNNNSKNFIFNPFCIHLLYTLAPQNIVVLIKNSTDVIHSKMDCSNVEGEGSFGV